MTRAVLALILLSGFTACAARAPQPAAFPSVAPRLAVVSWNLHDDRGDVGALLRDLRGGRLTGGAPPQAVALLLQEASPRTGNGELHAYFAPVRGTGDAARGNAILSSLPLRDGRTIPLPQERQPRAAAVATVRMDGLDLLLVNVHLENRASWWKGGLPGDAARARQMEALLAQLPGGPGVLGGDLNIWLGTAERAYTAAAAAFPDAVVPPPQPTFRERLALDHLFFRLPGGWRAFRAPARGRYGSDHLPVVGVLVNL